MTYKLLCAAAVAALSVGAVQASAATIVIDNFDDNQAVGDNPVDTSGFPTNSQVGPSANIIGGYRDLLVETDGDAGGEAILDTTLEASNSALSFSNKDGVTGRGWVTYDGANVIGGDPNTVDVDGFGAGGIDFLDGPGAGFFFEILTADLQGLYIEIRAWDVAGTLATFAESLPAGGGNPFVPLGAFAGAIDWNQVGALQFFAQSGINSDVVSLDGSIGSITVETGVIPLPASAFLLLGGLGGLTAFGVRRRKKA